MKLSSLWSPETGFRDSCWNRVIFLVYSSWGFALGSWGKCLFSSSAPCLPGFLVLLLPSSHHPTRSLSLPLLQSWQSLCPVQLFFCISYHFTQFQDLSPGLSQQHSPLSNLSSVNTRRTEIINGPMEGGILWNVVSFHYKCYWMVKLFNHMLVNTLMKVNQFIIFDSSRIISNRY